MNLARRMISAGALIGCLTVVGCSAAPDREEIAERFEIELAAGAGDSVDLTELSESLADDALDGKCGSDGFRSGIESEPILVYAWSATCLMYFEDDMNDAQQDQAKQDIIDFAVLDPEP